jgi:hypothetical protein
MTFASGTRLGAYDIVALIGASGMGLCTDAAMAMAGSADCRILKCH